MNGNPRPVALRPCDVTTESAHELEGMSIYLSRLADQVAPYHPQAAAEWRAESAEFRRLADARFTGSAR